MHPCQSRFTTPSPGSPESVPGKPETVPRTEPGLAKLIGTPLVYLSRNILEDRKNGRKCFRKRPEIHMQDK